MLGQQSVVQLFGVETAPLSGPEAASAAGELRVRIAAAVDSLPPPFRSAFILVIDQGLTHAQAARVLDCSENTVSWRMHKARKILESELRPFFKEVTDEM